MGSHQLLFDAMNAAFGWPMTAGRLNQNRRTSLTDDLLARAVEALAVWKQ